MSDIVLEIIRAIVVSVIFIYLLKVSGKEKIRKQEGWLYILMGFGLILFGMFIDITDNFPGLNRYIVIGDTEYQAFLEKVIGYLLGFILLAVGFWKWMPTIVRLRIAERELKNSHDKLELIVDERTSELRKATESLKIEIEEHKQAEEALQESKLLLRATIESTADGILVVDKNGSVIHTNNRFAQIWGIPNEIIETGDDEKLLSYVLNRLKYPEEFLSKVQELYISANEALDTIYFKNGQVVERYSCPLKRNEKIVGRVWSFRDITEQKHAEEALRESEERLKAIFDANPDPIVVYNN
jgi:PAS domain S-box-containing protein